jgi:uncharacterized protein
MNQENKDEIVSMTKEYGGEWGINHTLRLLHLIDIIGKDLEYDPDIVWVSAYLHDWGGYVPWIQPGVDHAVRSTQVAQTFLQERKFTRTFIDHCLECISLHHIGGSERSIESILLSDADALDFLGVVGVLRDFSKNPKDLRKACETTKKRREKLPGSLCLDRSKEIAVERVRQMDELFTRFEQDTWGYY